MINQIVAGLLLAEGVASGIIAYVLFRKKSAKLARCQRTLGDVVEVKEHSGSEGTTRHPVIRYVTATGKEAAFESKYGSSNWKVRAGDKLEILVNPNNPSEAEVVSFMAQWGLPLILAIVFVGSILAAPVAYLLLRP